jgi:DNA-binding HxlR family transcriptional regulator
VHYTGRVKSYGQYCSVAKALDVVGDRWTLLIVRELLTQGPCRYTDLRAGLPGIASNLLSARLKEMEAARLITRTAAPPPIATTLFDLTDRGRELKDVLYALGRWGVDLMVTADGSDAFRSGWFTFATENFLTDTDPAAPEVTIGLNATDAAPVHVVVGHGEVELRQGPAPDPGLTLAGEPRLIMGVLSGKLPVDKARAAGLSVAGDPSVLARAVHAHPA